VGVVGVTGVGETGLEELAGVVTDIEKDWADGLLEVSYAKTAYEYWVEAETDESIYVVPDVTEARYVPLRYILYPATATLSEEAGQDKLTDDEVTDVVANPVGIFGAWVSAIGVLEY
jgi:hypothetical protein